MGPNLVKSMSKAVGTEMDEIEVFTEVKKATVTLLGKGGRRSIPVD